MSQNATTKLFAERLEELTEFTRDKDYTKSDKTQANEMDIKYQTFRKYLNDNAECSIDNLKKIAKYYNVSADYLLGLPREETENTKALNVSDYTQLSPKAVEALHNYNTNNDQNYIILTEWEKDICTIMSQLFEQNIIQDIVYYTFSLMQASDIQINHEMDYTAFTHNDDECNIGKLMLFETFERIVNTFDRRVTEKDKYTALKQKHDQLLAEQIRNGFDRWASILNDDNKINQLQVDDRLLAKQMRKAVNDLASKLNDDKQYNQLIDNLEKKRIRLKENKEGD